MKPMEAAVVKSEGYLIFRVGNGRLEDWGLYETYEAAKKHMAASGLSAEWKIATINCYFRTKTKQSGRASSASGVCLGPETWIAIEISNGAVVIAYGPFDTNGEAMQFAAGYDNRMLQKPTGYDGEMVVRKLRRPSSAPLGGRRGG